MSYKCAVTTGDWSAGATWRTNFNTPTMHASSNLTITVGGVFTEDQVAPNSTDKIEGLVFAPVAGYAGRTITITLQENSVDVGTPIVLTGNNIRLNQPMLALLASGFTVTSGRTYRFKIQTDAGAPTCALSTTATRGAAIILKDTTGAPAAGDHPYVLPINASTGITVTIDNTSAVAGDGSAPISVFYTGLLLRSWNNMCIGAAASVAAEVAFKTNADTKLTWSSNILVYPGAKWTQKPDSSHRSDMYMSAASALSCFFGGYDGAIVDVEGDPKANPDYWRTTLVSGLGTAASPAVTATPVDWKVGDYVYFAPGTNSGTNYNEGEYRYIITKNSSSSYVLSSTKGGSENALVYTHTSSYIFNATHNVRWDALTANSWHINLNDTTSGGANMVFKNADLSGLTTSGSTARAAFCVNGTATIEDLSHADNTTAGAVFNWPNNVYSTHPTIKRLFTANGGSAGNSQDGRIILSGTNNKFFEDCWVADSSKVGWKIAGNNNTFTRCGGVAGGKGGALPELYGSWNITGNYNQFISCESHAERGYGILLYQSVVDSVFTNFISGTKADNKLGTISKSSSFIDYCKVVFLGLVQSETNLILNYRTNLSEGSEIAFQDLNGNTSQHRWYTNHGSFWSAGSGLTDTTVRTASSLSLAIKPEDSTLGGAVMSVKIPANPTSIAQFYGYIYRNATFSSGVIKVDLFLPGNTTVTPDATYTLPTTTGAWLPFVLSAYNSNTTSRYATIRLTAVSSTAGAYAFLDDIYDAGTGNKVAGLDLWDNGKISPIIVASDYSSIPDQARVAVWSDTDTYGAGTKADDLANATAPSASAVADAVWDEAKSAHTTAGTYGKSVADQEILTKGLYGK